MIEVTIGEVCEVTKGKTGIKGAIPGIYPLVVTAEERLTNNEYQFNASAVCIPLVSSTGHGHASIKRIHYQEGKFALGSILAAAIPKDEKFLSAKYLHIYLNYFKSKVLVPLMKGAANVTLTVDSLKTAVIAVPSIEKQLEIIVLEKQLEDSLSKLKNNFHNKANLIQQLKKSILQDAVQGKLVPQDPNDEAVIELLKKIKAEKEKLIKERRIKKKETPYELPRGWEWCRLGEVTNFGSSEKINSDEIAENTWVLDLEDIEKKSSKLLKKVNFKDRKSLSTKSIFYKGDVLYGKLRPYLDKVLIADEDGICTTEILPIRGYNYLNPSYLRIYLKNPYFINYVNARVYGMKMPRLGTEDGKKALIPLPPIKEQIRIGIKVDKLMELCDKLEEKIKESQNNVDLLMQAVLQEAFSSDDFIKTK